MPERDNIGGGQFPERHQPVLVIEGNELGLSILGIQDGETIEVERLFFIEAPPGGADDQGAVAQIG